MAKVKFGLKNCYYAMIDTPATATTSATFKAPVAIPGAVSISLEPQGENTSFYADDVAYFTVGGSTGYSGELEIALIPDSFLKDALGENQSEAGSSIELADASPKEFALMFEFTTDSKAQRHVFYRCTATRPAVAGNTKGESVTVSTEKITITATPIYNAKLDANIVKAKADDTNAGYTDWYTTVWQPAV